MEASDLVGRRLTLLLLGETESGEDECVVIPGTVAQKADSLFLDRGSAKPPFELRSEWLEHIRPVEGELKAVFQNGDYFLPLSVGRVSPDEDPDPSLPTGLRWPDAQ